MRKRPNLRKKFKRGFVKNKKIEKRCSKNSLFKMKLHILQHCAF